MGKRATFYTGASSRGGNSPHAEERRLRREREVKARWAAAKAAHAAAEAARNGETGRDLRPEEV